MIQDSLSKKWVAMFFLSISNIGCLKDDCDCMADEHIVSHVTENNIGRFKNNSKTASGIQAGYPVTIKWSDSKKVSDFTEDAKSRKDPFNTLTSMHDKASLNGGIDLSSYVYQKLQDVELLDESIPPSSEHIEEDTGITKYSGIIHVDFPLAIVEDRNGESYQLKLGDKLPLSSWIVHSIAPDVLIVKNPANNSLISIENN